MVFCFLAFFLSCFSGGGSTIKKEKTISPQSFEMDWSYLLALTFKAIKAPSSFSGDVLFFLFLLSLIVSSIKTKNNKGFNFMSISFQQLPL